MDNSLNPFEVISQHFIILQNQVQQLQEQFLKVSHSEEDDLLNLQEVAKLLHKSEDTIYGYTHKRQIPHAKPLGSLIFSKKEILEWVKTFKVKTVDEIDIDADNHLSKEASEKSCIK